MIPVNTRPSTREFVRGDGVQRRGRARGSHPCAAAGPVRRPSAATACRPESSARSRRRSCPRRRLPAPPSSRVLPASIISDRYFSSRQPVDQPPQIGAAAGPVERQHLDARGSPAPCARSADAAEVVTTTRSSAAARHHLANRAECAAANRARCAAAAGCAPGPCDRSAGNRRPAPCRCR